MKDKYIIQHRSSEAIAVIDAVERSLDPTDSGSEVQCQLTAIRGLIAAQTE